MASVAANILYTAADAAAATAAATWNNFARAHMHDFAEGA